MQSQCRVPINQKETMMVVGRGGEVGFEVK